MAPEIHPLRLIRCARLHTVVGGQTGAEQADAVLVQGDRVAAVGRFDDLARSAPRAQLLDLRPCTITPGLTDAHVHLVEWSLARRQTDLGRSGSPEAAAARLAEAATGPAEGASRRGGTGGAGEWIRGVGWDPHRWAEAPSRHHLDRHFPDRPVLLQSHDLHSLWANTAALAAAGVTAGTPDPEGGRIERDADGEPSGVVRDNAMPLLYRAAPAPEWAERRQATLDGQGALHRLGFTGVHTVEPDSLGLLQALLASRHLRLRVLQHLPLDGLDDAIRLGIRSGFGGPWLRIGGVKMFLDGALGSRTALLREPYAGTTDDRGVSTLSPDRFRDAVRRGVAAGLASTVHAIGDAAMDLALDVLGGEGGELEGFIPHRIEHAQLIAPDQLEHPAWGRVVASVQPSHLMTDWAAADRHWGDRARWAYAFASLEQAGATLAIGSDAPVEPPEPRQAFHAAVNRQDLEDKPSAGWYPQERLKPERVLAGYTVGAARAAGDARQGRLATGSFADLVAWDRDPLATPEEHLLSMEVRLTMVGGEVVWNCDGKDG